MNKWMKEEMNEWINKLMNEGMNEWINEYEFNCRKAIFRITK